MPKQSMIALNLHGLVDIEFDKHSLIDMESEGDIIDRSLKMAPLSVRHYHLAQFLQARNPAVFTASRELGHVGRYH